MGLFSIKEGLRIIGDVQASVLTGDYNPADGAGVAAELGSIFLHQSGVTYKKTGAGDTEWQPYSEIENSGLVWESVATAAVLEADRGYVVDSSSVYTLTMPANPILGTRIGFATLANAETNIVTVDFNSKKFNGLTDTLELDLNYAYVEFLFTGNAETGWVLSNSDESGNIANMRLFIGNDDNADPGIPEYTEFNTVASQDSLEAAIDKLDIESGDVKNFIGKSDTADDLPTYSGLADNGLPADYVPGYVVDEDNLFVSVAKLDDQLQETNALAVAGVEWGPLLNAITSDDPTGKTSGAFSDDSGGIDGTNFWDETQWADGDQVLSSNASVLGHIFEWTADTAGGEWIDQGALLDYHARSVKYDFLDAVSGQRDGAAYMMKADGPQVIKIADFDMSSAGTIKMAGGYSPVSGDPSASDSIQGAIQKVDGNNDAQDTLLGTSQGDTSLGNTGWNLVDDNTTVKNTLQTLDNTVDDNSTYVGRDNSVNDSMPDFSGLAENGMPAGYTPEYVTDSENLTLSVAKLDNSLKLFVDGTASGSTITGISAETAIDTYTAAGNIGAKYFILAWDGTGNRYASEFYVLNNTTEVDFTEYGVLLVGTISIDIVVTVEGGNVTVKATPESGTFTIKSQRTLISE